MFKAYMLFLVLFINNLMVHSQRFGEFIQAYEAKGRTLNYGSSTTLRCYGYHSCENVIIPQAGYRIVECLGYGGCINGAALTASTLTCGPYGCHNSQSIRAGTLECEGRNSCSNVNKITAEKAVNCYGDDSCKDSTINLIHSEYSQRQIRCIGDDSCNSATISAQKVSITGPVAARYATLDSSYLPTMDVISTGSHSLLGSEFLCRGSECTLTCDGTGCFSLDYFCYSSSKCTVYPVECESVPCGSGETVNGTHCPCIYRATSLEEDTKFTEYIETKNMDKKHTQFINKNESLCSEGIDNDEMNRND